ncbi:hypothetical protein JCM16303_005382 [Sporobolomyces ruberrimus]
MYGRPPPSGPRGGGGTGGYNHYPPSSSSSHAGLGSTAYGGGGGSRGGPPPPSTMAPSPYEPSPQQQDVVGGEKFSLFVGSIADGVENGWLERILQVAGPILSFRRPSPPFAFVEYSDPESVLRCLSVVNGTKLKSLNGGNEKNLLVKADEKTRARLDEYEKTRVLSESTSDLTLQAQQDLASIVSRIAAGDSVPAAGVSLDASSSPSSSLLLNPQQTEAQAKAERLADHLKDLAPEDLPDEQRATTLSSIAAFRERSMRKQNERKELDRQIEERRQAMIQRKLQQQHQAPPPMMNNPGQVDPQSYNQPIGFVKQEGEMGQQPGGRGGGEPPEIDDARRERERAEQEHRHQEQIFRDRERRFEQRERGRIQAWEREKMRERSIVEQEDRERTFMAERLATWDDEREAERGREGFYVDRVRWRAQRRAVRQREEDFDARDRALEAQRLAQISQQSDSFLAQHADLFADQVGCAENASSTSGTQPGAGAVKLTFGSTAKPKVVEPAPKRPAVLGMGEEEEEGRRKRELIPLSYSDDEDDEKKKDPAASAAPSEDRDKKSRLTGREKEKRIMEIEDSIPRDKQKLFGWDVKWASLNEGMIKRRISPFANKCIVEYLGAEEAELLNAVLEHVRAHKAAQELVDELEPVLDEESTELVTKVWKVLVTETELVHAGF